MFNQNFKKLHMLILYHLCENLENRWKTEENTRIQFSIKFKLTEKMRECLDK